MPCGSTLRKLSAPGWAERDRRVFDAGRERGVLVAVTTAGGYGRMIEDTAAMHLGTLRAPLASHAQWNNTVHD